MPATKAGPPASKFQISETNGSLGALTAGNTSLVFSPLMQAHADEHRAAVIRMRLTRYGPDATAITDTARFFWRTGRMVLGENCDVQFPVQCDGQWHEYHIPLSQDLHWRATICQIFLNPGRQSRVKVELDFLRLVN